MSQKRVYALFLSLFGAGALLLATLGGPGWAASELPPVPARQQPAPSVQAVGDVTPFTGPEAAQVYFVRLSDQPVARYTGGLPGLAATSLRATGAQAFNPRSPTSLAYQGYLLSQQAQTRSAIEAALGRPVPLRFQYQYVYNGFSVQLNPAEAAQVAALPGVAEVQASTPRYPHTDRGPGWTGAEGIWDGSAVADGPGTMGEGVIIGTTVNQQVWERTLRKALRGKEPYVVQQRAKIATDTFPLFHHGGIRWTERSVVSGFFFSSAGIGLIGRFSGNPVVNVSRGGGLIPALWVH